MKDILKRLVRLEGGADLMQPNSSNGLASLLQASVVAAWCGDLQSHESLAEGHARALGYDTLRDYRFALGTKDPGWTARHNAMWTKLLHEHGLNAEAPGDQFLPVLERLLTKVPEHIQRELQKRVEVLSYES